jgi:hypothetical protein
LATATSTTLQVGMVLINQDMISLEQRDLKGIVSLD